MASPSKSQLLLPSISPSSAHEVTSRRWCSVGRVHEVNPNRISCRRGFSLVTLRDRERHRPFLASPAESRPVLVVRRLHQCSKLRIGSHVSLHSECISFEPSPSCAPQGVLLLVDRLQAE